MIYTSYFSKVAKIREFEENSSFICIARSQPKRCNFCTLPMLFPSSSLLNLYKSGLINEQEFTVSYNKQFDSVNINYIRNMLFGKEGIDTILLCWEKPEDFCHRHLLSKWLNKHGVECQEWNLDQLSPASRDTINEQLSIL